MNGHKKLKLVKLNIGQFFSRIKSCIKEKKQYIVDKLIQGLPVESLEYKDLGPESDIKNGEEYLQALHWGLKNRKVKNIALTGPYGSGKSSIIKSYLNKHPSTKALNISLATFDYKKKDDDDFENIIELGILKQLFYKVDSNKIPQSRYRKIRKQYYRRYFFVTMGIVLSVLLTVAFFVPSVMENICDKINESGNYYKIDELFSYIIVIIFGIFGIAVIAYVLKWSFSKFRVKEVNIADKATVADEKDESSIFDKSMDEIVYFFEVTTYNTVFIEDLDRFDSTQIFVKLRELNTILNNYDLIKRKIVFVYAIRDDMFVEKERTKFFDFIIPVIPIINSTNSGEILREKLKIKKQDDGIERSLLYDISSSYVTLVSPFVEDMRVLTNICNEFIVYKNTLNSVKLKDEEMFSIIIFKNLYPEDFAKLESEKGIVKKAFEDKKIFIKIKQNELEQQKVENKEILNGIEKDILNDVREVKSAFLDYLVGTNGPFVECNLDREKYSYSAIMRNQIDISKFENASQIKVFNKEDSGYYRQPVNIITREQNDILEKIKNYCKRIKYLENNEELRKEERRKQIEKCDKMISELHTYSLKTLIEKFGSEDIFSKDVKQNKFLVFLFRKGFINENYADYINYFHPNSITKDEMNYIRGIRMQEAVGEFSYTIKNVEQVCERIEDYEFKQTEALNFDIVDFLLTKRVNDKKCNELFAGLAEGDKMHDNFIREYIERKRNIEIFVNLLCKYYKNFWVKIANSDLIPEESKFYYLFLIIEYADLDDIFAMNESELIDIDDENVDYNDACEIYGIYEANWIKYFIESNENALVELSKVDTDKMIQVIDELDINFNNIEIDDADKKVLTYIFENSRYVLNLNMIQSLFEFFYPERFEFFYSEGFKELETSNYTVILETAYKPLLTYIYDNFEKYVSEIVIGLETNVDESINAVEDILERLFDCNVDLCLSILDKENVIWDNIESCCICSNDKKEERKVIWDYVLKNRKIKEVWNNYFGYYKEYGLTSELVEWVNIAINTLIQEQRTERLTDKVIKEIIIKNISLEAFTKLTENYKVDNFDCRLSDFDSSKIAVLIEHNYIPFTIEYLNEMKQEAPKQVVDYIISNQEEFMQNITNITLEINTILNLIKSGQFVGNEINVLLRMFAPTNMDSKMAYEIRNLEIKLEKPYVEKAWELLEEPDRYQLFLNQIDIYSNDEIALKLDTLDTAYKALSDRSRRHREYLPVNNYNEKLLDKLKKKNYITSLEKEWYDKEDFNTHTKRHMQRFVVWVKQNNRKQ